MLELNAKHKIARAVHIPRMPLKDVQCLKGHQEKQTHLRNLLLLLQKLSGAMLTGIASAVMIGNVLICLALLLGGTAFILQLISNISGFNS